MLRRSCRVRSLPALAVFLTASAGGAQYTALKPGDALPALSGQTAAGKLLDLPTAAAGGVAVVIFSFSRAGGRDAQGWEQHISKDDPQLPIYPVIFLESVPGMFRSLAISGIRKGMPPAMLERTLLIYQQQASWKQSLDAKDDRYASVLVLDQHGHIRWIASGPFTDALHLRLRGDIRP